MDGKIQQTLHSYFYPVRRSTPRNRYSNEKLFPSAFKYTPTTSRKDGCKRSTKRSCVSQLSSCIQNKKTSFEVLKYGQRGEYATFQDVRYLNEDEFVQEKPGCSCPLGELPEELQVEYSLETVLHPQETSAAFRSISAETLSKLLLTFTNGEFNKRFILVDCRYPFEYKEGHIKGAINVFDPKDIANVFFPAEESSSSCVFQKIPIFYCEFSQKRGPAMAHNLRAFDRARNEKRYPEVDYKEMYLLDRGYNAFYKFAKNMDLCEPNMYTRMVDPRHARELRKYSFHRTKTMVSFDLTVSKDRSSLISRCNRKRLHYAKLGLPSGCKYLDETSPSAKTDDKQVSFVLCARENMDDSSSDCELSELSESPIQFQQLKLSKNIDNILVP